MRRCSNSLGLSRLAATVASGFLVAAFVATANAPTISAVHVSFARIAVVGGPQVGATSPLALPPNADLGPSALFNGVSCWGAGDCVAVEQYTSSAGTLQAMVATEANAQWAEANEVSLPDSAGGNPDASLDGVSCTSAGNCTAVGDYSDLSGDPEAMAATEAGGTWAQAVELSTPANTGTEPGANLGGVSCVGTGNCTAVGQYSDTSGNQQAMAATETGGTWAGAVEVTVAANGNPNARLDGISCWSAGDCTAVGQDNGLGGILATETGGTWGAATQVEGPTGSEGADLDAVSCWGDQDCTATGYDVDNGGNQHAVVATETTGSWAQAVVVSPPGNAPTAQNAIALGGISCQSAGNCTAGGSYADPAGHTQAMVATETSGVWEPSLEVAMPADAGVQPLARLVAASCSSPGSCTAVGSYLGLSGNQRAMATTETGGTWAQATEGLPPANAGAQSSAALEAVSCWSAGNCTGAGQYLDTLGNEQAMVATETGGTWAAAVELTTPGHTGLTLDASLTGISCPSQATCTASGWFVDGAGHLQAMVASETGGTWAPAVELTTPGNTGTDPRAGLEGISCSSAGNCSAAGQYTDTSGNAQAMVATETGGTWAPAVEVAAPAGAGADPYAMLNGISCWGAGIAPRRAGTWSPGTFGRWWRPLPTGRGSRPPKSAFPLMLSAVSSRLL